MRRVRITKLLWASSLVLVRVGCGNAAASPQAAGPASSSARGVTTAPIVAVTGIPPAVTVKATDGLMFVPGTVTVRTGQVVQWTNTGTTPHNVTFDGPHSGTLDAGDTYEAKFGAPGTYHYICTFHAPNMGGTVIATG